MRRRPRRPAVKGVGTFMYQYTAAQWLLLFFCYCFFGWVWETGLVSIRSRTFTNRGFLFGPWIPIYGFGAVIILWLTLPARENLILVYLLGMTGATALEYVTGAAMERIFHVRYWDYSAQPLNLNGHICLFCSLGWGVFSVLLVRVIHPPIETIVLAVHPLLTELLSFVLLAAFTVDTTRSVQEALHLRELLAQLAENNETLVKIQKRLDEAAASLAENSAQLRRRMDEMEVRLQELRAGAQLSRAAGRQALESALEEARQRRKNLLELLNEKVDAVLESAQRETPLAEDLRSFKEKLRSVELNMAARKDRDFHRAAGLLRRNPSAISRRHGRELEQLRRFDARRRRKRQ